MKLYISSIYAPWLHPGVSLQVHVRERIRMAGTTDNVPESGGRVKGVSIVKPVVYGNIAQYFGKTREEDGHTHQWTVYVKPYRNEDMSTFIKKVHFKLHNTFPDPNRVVVKPPYEVTETGWGEFEIAITIFFHDSSEQPFVTLYHILTLYPPGEDTVPDEKPVVTEYYEEIVFQDPTPLMLNLLTTTRKLTIGPWKHETDFEEIKEKTLQNILNAKSKIHDETKYLKERLKLAKKANAKYKAEIAKWQVDSPTNQRKV